MGLRSKRQSQSGVRKKTGPQSYNCVNAHPAKPLPNEEAKRPQGFQTRTQRRHQHLDFSLVRPCPTSDPKKWEIINFCYLLTLKGASQVALVVKNLPANAGNVRDLGLIPGLGRSPGKGNGHPLQYSCLENPMDRRAWRATVCGVAKNQTQLSN